MSNRAFRRSKGGQHALHETGLKRLGMRIVELERELASARELLNHAVSLLSQAVLSEDGIDCDAAMELADAVQENLQVSGKTSDWHYNSMVYDRLCTALGIDNGDEIDVLPLVERALAELAELRRAR